jgi:hypothetical protein
MYANEEGRSGDEGQHRFTPIRLKRHSKPLVAIRLSLQRPRSMRILFSQPLRTLTIFVLSL